MPFFYISNGLNEAQEDTSFVSQPGVEQSILLESGLARSIVSRVIRTLHFASCIVAGKKQCVNIINKKNYLINIWDCDYSPCLCISHHTMLDYACFLNSGSSIRIWSANLFDSRRPHKSRTQKYGSVNSKRAHFPSGICRAFVILFWKSYKCPMVGPGVYTKTPRCGLKIGCKWPTRDNTKIAVSSK